MRTRPSTGDTSDAGGPPGRGEAGPSERTRWLTAAEQRAWRIHLATSRLLIRQLDQDLHPFGLSITDYEILVELSEAPGLRMRMSALADATAQSRSRLSHQISRMEARGLVRRDACPGDRRGLFAVLTERGLTTIRRVAPHHVASVRRHFIDLLSEQQLAAVRDGYGAVLDHLRRIADRA